MIEGAEFIALVYGLEYGVQTHASGEADVVITRVGGDEVLDTEGFPNRAEAVEFIRNRANHVPLTPIPRCGTSKFVQYRPNKPHGRG